MLSRRIVRRKTNPDQKSVESLVAPVGGPIRGRGELIGSVIDRKAILDGGGHRWRDKLFLDRRP